MSDQPKGVEKTRISVTLTRPYLDALIRLVEEGLYLEKGEIVKQSMRDLFRNHGIEPFKVLEEPAEEE
jgi:Arc/MetJ-type ribon-helix-helix transcriptional regulator